MGVTCDTCTGELVIAGVSMHNEAWCVLDLTELWLPGDLRGSDRLLPGVVGVKPYRRRLTVTAHSLPMVLAGDVDRFGADQADPWEGLQANIDYLRANVVDPTNTGDGTRVATLTMPSGAVRSAAIHVLDLQLGVKVAGRARATLDISIPGGAFT